MQVLQSAERILGFGHVHAGGVGQVLARIGCHRAHIAHHGGSVRSSSRQPLRAKDQEPQDGENHDLADADVEHRLRVRREPCSWHPAGTSLILTTIQDHPDADGPPLPHSLNHDRLPGELIADGHHEFFSAIHRAATQLDDEVSRAQSGDSRRALCGDGCQERSGAGVGGIDDDAQDRRA